MNYALDSDKHSIVPCFGLNLRCVCPGSIRRCSSFWIGLYGQCWVFGMEFCQDIVDELMRIRRNKLPFFQRGIRARSFIVSML